MNPTNGAKDALTSPANLASEARKKFGSQTNPESASVATRKAC